MEIICKDRVFTLKNGSDVLLHTDANTPMVYVGYGEERVEMYRGNFKLEDHLLERRPLTLTSARVTEQGTGWILRASSSCWSPRKRALSP